MSSVLMTSSFKNAPQKIFFFDCKNCLRAFSKLLCQQNTYLTILTYRNCRTSIFLMATTKFFLYKLYQQYFFCINFVLKELIFIFLVCITYVVVIIKNLIFSISPNKFFQKRLKRLFCYPILCIA